MKIRPRHLLVLLLMVALVGFWITRKTVPSSVEVAPNQTLESPQPRPVVEIADFDEWVEVHTKDRSPAIVAQGVALAKERLALVQELIRTDPKRALQMALTPKLRAELPEEVLAHSERLIAGEGFFGVMAICGGHHGAGESHASDRIEREAVIRGERFKAHVYGKGFDRLTEENASLYGIAVGDEIALHEELLVLLEPAEMPEETANRGGIAGVYKGESLWFETVEEAATYLKELQPENQDLPTAAAGGLTFDPASPPSGTAPPTAEYNEYVGTNSHQYGPKTVMVFIIQTSDGGTYSNPPSLATLNSQLNDSSQWYYDASFRQTWFGPKVKNPDLPNELHIPRLVVTPVLQLPQTTAFYYGNFGQLQSDCLAAARALGGTWAIGQVNDYANFDRWVPMCNQKLIGSTGLAYVGGKFAWVGDSLAGGVTLHEWGHNWGVYHANFWDPTSTGVSRNPSNGHGEYGDGADVMGGGSGFFNPLFLQELGFLREDRNEIQRALTSGTYRIFNHTDAYSKVPESLVRSLVVPITGYTGSDKRLVLGFRREGGSDQGINRAGWNRNGIEIHSDNTSSNFGNNDGSHFLDATPLSKPLDDRDDGAVFIGRTYSEPSALNGTQLFGGLHITPTARGNVTDSGGRVHEYIDVRVNYGNDILPANAAPTASIGLSNSTPAPAQSVTLTANVTDPDGDPTACYWTFGDGTRSLNALATQTKSWASAGIYEVKLEVSDMKGQVTPTSLFVNVGNLPYRDPENPSSSLDGLAYRYYGGAFNNVPDVANLFPEKDGTVATFDLSPRTSGTNFVFEYTGYIQIPAQDIYVFSTRSEDGSKLYIGDTLVVNNDGDRSATAEVSANIALKAGLHAIRLVMNHKSGAPDLLVSWRSASVNGGAKQPIPASALRQRDWAANALPAVAITQPTAGEELPPFSSIQLQAAASDSDGIAKVQYFVGSTYLGQATSAPYTYTWNQVGVGIYQVMAIATDTTGRWSKSTPFTVNVVQPPPRNLVGIKFLGDQSNIHTLFASDTAGAFYQARSWNTGVNNSGSLSNLIDQSGAVTSMRAVWDAGNSFTTAGNSADGQRRMMKTGIYKNGTAVLTFSQIPYLEYDVYVYSDAPDSFDSDVQTRSYMIGSSTRYAQGSITKNDGIGDYPGYDTWAGFRESTATAAGDPISTRLGNYTVFRGLSGPGFVLTTTGNVNAMQVVEIPSGIPRVLLSETAFATTVSESGATDSYTAVLSVAPASNVTVTLTPNAQLTLDKVSLTFTPANWNVPQNVTVRAVDDALAQGNRSVSVAHSISGSGAYASIIVPPVNVSITDNDMPTVSVAAVGSPTEGGAATYQITRFGAVSLASALTVNFQMSGTASLSADYTLSGSGVSHNSATGAGNVVIPSGAGQVFVTFTATNDAAAESAESAILTLQGAAGYALGTSAATLTIVDDDSVDYFVQHFAAGQPETSFDLANRKLTFTPNGSPSYYGAVLQTISSYPTSTSGHTDLVSTPLTFGNLDIGYWTYALPAPFNFYGTTYNTIYISTNGGITFSTGDGSDGLSIANAANNSHFAQRRIAAFWRDLSLTSASGNGGGNLYVGRVTTAGQQRTVVTWNAVKGYNDSQTNHFQIELWDNGNLSIGWLNCGSASPMIGLSSQNSSTLPVGFVSSNLSGYTAGTPTNQAPAFASAAILNGVVGQSYNYAVVANDPDNNPLTIVATQKPAWLTLTGQGNGTATLAGTPTASGTYDVVLQVSDGTASVTQAFTLLVVPVGGNQAPVFTSSPSSTMASVGISFSYPISATDADGHRLSITASVKPGWLAFVDQGNGTATLSGTPPAAASGITHQVVLQVGDGISAVTQSFGLFVQAGPQITILRPDVDRVYLPDASFTLALEAAVTDDGFPQPSNIATLWAVVSGPSGSAVGSPFAPASTVRFSQNGSYVVRMSASDGVVTNTKDINVDVGGTGYGPNGLKAEYFSNTSLLGSPAVTRTDAKIDSGTFATFPPSGMLDQNFSVRWTGTVTPLHTEAYSFIPATDDGVRLWINGVQVVDDWRNKGGTDSPTTPIALTANVPVPITMEYYQGGGGFGAKLDWSSTSQTRQTIPTTAFNTYAPSSNQAPVVNAIGVSTESVPPATAVTLSGTATDDGNPNPPSALTTLWTRVSGPGLVNFVTPGNPTTLANFSDAGIYVLRLSADDGEIKVSSEVTVAVVDPPGSTFTIDGTISGTASPVTVTDGYRSTTSTGGSSNTYALSGVPAGTWNLRATLAGASFSPVGFVNPVTISSDSSGKNFTLDAMVKYSISGTVTNLGNPLIGATVVGGAVNSSTDTRGGYYLPGLAAGSYVVTPNSGTYAFAPASRNVTIASTNSTGQDFATTVVDNPPTVANAASATPSSVTGTSTNLSVLGADDNGEPLLVYQWSTVGSPPAPVSFSAQGTNAAKNCVATFSKSGSYTLRATLTDTSGGNVTSDVSVTVLQSPAAILVTPANPSVAVSGSRQFTASAMDQFGILLATQPNFVWNVSGGGTINSSGLFTAGGSAGGPFTVTANSGAVSGTTSVSITTQTVLSAIADTYVRDGNVSGTDFAAQNYGADPYLRVKNDAIGYARRTFIRFDTTGVTGVTGAKIRLFMPNSQADTSPVNTSIHAVANTTWVEGAGTLAAPLTAASGMTHNTIPAIGVKIATTNVVNDSNSWYEWDVSSYLLSEKAAGRHVVSFAVLNDSTTVAAQTFNFSSRQAATNQPQLTLAVLPASAPYETWGNRTFSRPFTNKDPSVDFDGDGLVSLLEFVLGGDPTINDTPGVMPSVQSAAGENLIIRFNRSDESALTPEPVTVKVQVSDDMVVWSPSAEILIDAEAGSGPNGASYAVAQNGTDPDTITVTIPKNTAAKKFVRIFASR